jgi:hypothetical protein
MKHVENGKVYVVVVINRKPEVMLRTICWQRIEALQKKQYDQVWDAGVTIITQFFARLSLLDVECHPLSSSPYAAQ